MQYNNPIQQPNSSIKLPNQITQLNNPIQVIATIPSTTTVQNHIIAVIYSDKAVIYSGIATTYKDIAMI